MELSTGGQEPKLRDPEQKHRDEQPQALRVMVETGIERGDVEREDHDRGVSGSGTEGAELLDIGDEIAAAV